MVARQKFDNALLELRLNIIDLGKMVSKQIDTATKALIDQDLESAKKVVAGDKAVNEMQLSIEDKCILLIATQQPFAQDLRKVVSALKLAIYFERMGDLAADVAKVTIKIGREKLIKPLVDIPKMSALVQEMINLGSRAYIQEDSDAAVKMAEMDDQIDKLYSRSFDELTVIMVNDPTTITQAKYLLFVCRFLERMGDYCTNFAEEIVYISTGKRLDLNQ